MIIFRDDRFYMTCGEACYILQIKDGRLLHTWFGARVEAEDDIEPTPEELEEFAPFGGTDREEFGQVVDLSTGKTVKTHFRVTDYHVTKDKPKGDVPMLRGGETLHVWLCDKKTGLAAELFYTPYTRGGIARRAEITSLYGNGYRFKMPAITITAPAGGREISIDGLKFIGVEEDGRAYGCLAAYQGPMICRTEFIRDRDALSLIVDNNITIKKGVRYCAPEVLAVYSDNGIGGMTRIFHDIIRSEGKAGGELARRRILLFSPCGQSVEDGLTLGADGIVVPSTDTGRNAAAEKCREAGVLFGLDLAGTFDYGDEGAFDRIAKAIRETGAEFVSLGSMSDEGSIEYYANAYSLYERLSAEFPDLAIEGNPDLGSLCRCGTALAPGEEIWGDMTFDLLPPALLGSRVRFGDSPKTEFDKASLMCLGYELDAAKLSDNAKRALRAQIFCYQDDASLIAEGDLYKRKQCGGEAVAFVSKDKSRAYAVYVQTDRLRRGRMILSGLDSGNLYHVREVDKVYSGAALMSYGLSLPEKPGEGETVAFHLRQVADWE